MALRSSKSEHKCFSPLLPTKCSSSCEPSHFLTISQVAKSRKIRQCNVLLFMQGEKKIEASSGDEHNDQHHYSGRRRWCFNECACMHLMCFHAKLTIVSLFCKDFGILHSGRSRTQGQVTKAPHISMRHQAIVSGNSWDSSGQDQ